MHSLNQISCIIENLEGLRHNIKDDVEQVIIDQVIFDIKAGCSVFDTIDYWVRFMSVNLIERCYEIVSFAEAFRN